MGRFWWCLIAFAGCSEDGIPTGRPVDPCSVCAPGSVRAGRFIEGNAIDLVAANAAGQVVRAGPDHIAWLDAELAPRITVSLDDGMTNARKLALGPGGDAVLIAGHNDEIDGFVHTLYAFDAAGRERWRHRAGRNGPDFISVGVDRVFVTGHVGEVNFDVPLSDHFVAALDLNTGAVVWSKSPLSPDGSLQSMRVAALPDGGVAVVGAFRLGTQLALGGTAPTLTANGYTNGFVAALDDAGEGRWALLLDTQMTSRIQGVAAGPDGEVAVAGDWVGGGATLGSIAVSGSGMTALVDAGGVVRWAQSTTIVPTRVATEGSDVIVRGGIDRENYWLARTSAAGERWRDTTNSGYIETYPVAFTGDDVVAVFELISASASLELPETTLQGPGLLLAHLVP